MTLTLDWTLRLELMLHADDRTVSPREFAPFLEVSVASQHCGREFQPLQGHTQNSCDSPSSPFNPVYHYGFLVTWAHRTTHREGTSPELTPLSSGGRAPGSTAFPRPVSVLGTPCPSVPAATSFSEVLGDSAHLRISGWVRPRLH